jgi:hypothetical protein
MIEFVLRKCVLFVLMLSISLTAFAGKDRGGGNVYEAEFKQIGFQLYGDIRSKGLSAEQIGFELIRLEVALNEVQVVGTDKPLDLENLPRMAINSPIEKLITFSNSSWMILNSEQKRLLVLHEYLRFVGVDDSEYTFSLRIIQLLNQSSAFEPVPPVQSARARVFDVMSSRSTAFGSRYFTVIEEKDGAKYEFGVQCEDKLEIWPDSNARATGLQHTLYKSFDKGGRASCAVMLDILSSSQPGNPVKIILDPVRALSSPNDYVTIEY